MSQRPVQQVDDSIIHHNVRPVGKVQWVHGCAHHGVKVAEDEPLQGLHQVGGQRNGSVIVRLFSVR